MDDHLFADLGDEVRADVERTEYTLVNLNSYPWRHFPDVTRERTGNTVTIVSSSGRAVRYAVVSQSGPHLLLRRL